MITTAFRRLAVPILSVALLASCTEKRAGFEATYSGSVRATPAGLAADGIVFAVPRTRDLGDGRAVHTRVSGAMLKVAGHPPVLPMSVQESDDRYTVTIRLPEDLLEEAGTPGAPIEAELILPNEIGIRSFTGREHFVPDTTVLRVYLRPVHSGPLTRLGERVGDFLRSLYAAR